MDSVTTIYKIISYLGFSLAVVSAVIAVICFFRFNIIKLIGDLSGKTAKKSIEKMRLDNEKSGVKSYRTNPADAERGTITDVMRESQKFKNMPTADKTGKIESNPTTVLNNQTTVLNNADSSAKSTDVLDNATTLLGNATTVLNNQTTALSNADSSTKSTDVLDNATTLLGNATMVLNNQTTALNDSNTATINSTTVLEGGTTVLSDNSNSKVDNGFKIIRSVVQIHTNEVI